MSEKWQIDQWVESFAKSSYDSFYPTAIQKALNIDVRVVFARLKELVSDGKLIMELEIICPQCYSRVPVNNLNSHESILTCEDCGYEFEIEADIIFPRFRIEPSYKDYIKKTTQHCRFLFIKNHAARRNAANQFIS